MDIATIVGLIAFVTTLMVGIGSHLRVVIDPPTAIMVLGGGLALTLIALPLQQVVGLLGVVVRAFIIRITPPVIVVESAVQLAELARAEGVLALEFEVDRNPHDRFLTQGIRLAVDGTEPDLIMDILETEVRFIEDRHTEARGNVQIAGRNCLFAAGGASLLGLVLGSHLHAPTDRLIFFVSVALLYGVLAWAVAQALAHKLAAYSNLEILVKRMAIEAVMAIQSGDNPRIVEHKLSVFLAPSMRPGADAAAGDRRVPAYDETLVAEVQTLAAGAGTAESSGFHFNDIAGMTDTNVQRALRMLDQKDLVRGLKGAPEEVREKVMSNMSARVRFFLLEEIDVADVGAAEILDTQVRIANYLEKIAREGKIDLTEPAT
jgi:chemotaxis protein MotA